MNDGARRHRPLKSHSFEWPQCRMNLPLDGDGAADRSADCFGKTRTGGTDPQRSYTSRKSAPETCPSAKNKGAQRVAAHPHPPTSNVRAHTASSSSVSPLASSRLSVSASRTVSFSEQLCAAALEEELVKIEVAPIQSEVVNPNHVIVSKLRPQDNGAGHRDSSTHT